MHYRVEKPHLLNYGTDDRSDLITEKMFSKKTNRLIYIHFIIVKSIHFSRCSEYKHNKKRNVAYHCTFQCEFSKIITRYIYTRAI